MRATEFIFENSNYNNWVRYTNRSIELDFEEYKFKEFKKWQSRAKEIGARFPIFETVQQFQQALDAAPIVEIDSLGDVLNLTKNPSISSIKSMVSGYTMPRDVERIVNGIESNAKIPLPIILKGQHAMWIMAGNTRQSVARVMGISPKALLVDVKDLS